VALALGRPVDPAPMLLVSVPGRMEVRGSEPLEVWDGAHNPDGMARLVAELPALLGGRSPRVAVFSTLGEKDVAGMANLLSGVCEVIVATQSSNPRVLPAAALAAITGGEAEPDPVAARERAIRLAGRGGAVIVCGSLYLLHDLITRSHGVVAARSSA
jgi:dihydrofolate synthase / folylpolyglutamate synthase